MHSSFRPPSVHAVLIDQSEHMALRMQSGRTKAEYVASQVNKSLLQLIIKCTRGNSVRDDFRVIAFGHIGDTPVQVLPVPGLIPLSTLQASVRRLQPLNVTFEGSAACAHTRVVRDPVWIEPVSSGPRATSPMVEALRRELTVWCAEHPQTFPPVVHHFTDRLEESAVNNHPLQELTEIGTDFGPVRFHTVEVGSDGPIFARRRSEAPSKP